MSLCRSLFNSQLISLANKIFFWSASSFLPAFQPSETLHACAAMRARGCILRIHELHPYTYCGPENKNKNKKSARLTVTLFHCFIKFSITYEDKVDKCCYCLLLSISATASVSGCYHQHMLRLSDNDECIQRNKLKSALYCSDITAPTQSCDLHAVIFTHVTWPRGTAATYLPNQPSKKQERSTRRSDCRSYPHKCGYSSKAMV